MADKGETHELAGMEAGPADIQCPLCARNFAPLAIEAHASGCRGLDGHREAPMLGAFPPSASPPHLRGAPHNCICLRSIDAALLVTAALLVPAALPTLAAAATSASPASP